MSSDSTLMSVGVNDLSPANSISSVVYGVLCLPDVGHSLSEIPGGSGFIVAVSDGDESLVTILSGFSSSKASEHSILVQSDWLSFMVDLFALAFGFDFLAHSSLFVIMIIQ